MKQTVDRVVARWRSKPIWHTGHPYDCSVCGDFIDCSKFPKQKRWKCSNWRILIDAISTSAFAYLHALHARCTQSRTRTRRTRAGPRWQGRRPSTTSAAPPPPWTGPATSPPTQVSRVHDETLHFLICMFGKRSQEYVRTGSSPIPPGGCCYRWLDNCLGSQENKSCLDLTPWPLSIFHIISSLVLYILFLTYACLLDHLGLV